MRQTALLAGIAGLDAKTFPPTSDREWLDQLLQPEVDEPADRDPDSEAAQQGQAAAEAMFGGPADGTSP